MAALPHYFRPRRLPALVIGVFGALFLNPANAEIPDAHYVQVGSDGHLVLKGKRVRFWGAVTNHLAIRLTDDLQISRNETEETRAKNLQRLYASADRFAQRLVDLGFNLVRTWDSIDYTAAYQMGDGSPQDRFAYAMFALDKRGIKVWFSPPGNHLGTISSTNVDIIEDHATRDAWQRAVVDLKEKDGKPRSIRNSLVNVWDPRVQTLRMQRMRDIVNFPNHYKGGLRLADDPQIVVWELSNEEWWFTSMINGRWHTLPEFFRSGLQNRWQTFLSKKYGSDEELVKAWQFLLPGESLAEANVALTPLANKTNSAIINDVNPLAIAALTSTAGNVSRDSFVRQRGADVNEFFVGMIVAHKLAERDSFKSWGKSCRLSPLVFDTGDGFRIQSLYLHQLSDAVTMCTYLNGFAKDRQEPRFPWYSYLDEPPRMSHDVPWVEVGRVPGKPYFLYETQTLNPSKYRAEFPYRLLALGSIQDWDIINWHCFPRPVLAEDEQPYSNAMELAHEKFIAEGFHFRFDEVQSSAMRAAAEMFIAGTFKPVTNPTMITFGSKSLYSPDSMPYGKSFGDVGRRIAATAFRYGLQMKVDPTRQDDLVEGPTVSPRVHEANPVRPTSEIEFDWHRSHLKMESPGSLVYTGFLAQHRGPLRFDNGMVLDNVHIANEADMPFPVVEEEMFIAFGAVAQDGLPLAQSRSVLISLVSTSFNTGFKLNEDNVANAGTDKDVYRGMNSGVAPVLFARVGATLVAPSLDDMKYRWLDWHLQPLGEGVVRGGIIPIPASEPIFLIELTR